MTTIPLTQDKIKKAIQNLDLLSAEMEIWAAHDPAAAFSFHDLIVAATTVREIFVEYSGEVERRNKAAAKIEQFELDLTGE